MAHSQSMNVLGTFTNCPVTIAQNIPESKKKREIGKLYGFPCISDRIVGREHEVGTFWHLLNEEKADKNICHRVLITGLGGIGKTSLAVQCARSWVDQGKFSRAVFVNMETRESARQLFFKLEEDLFHNQQHEDIVSVEHVYAWYNNTGCKSLFVLDNIEQGGFVRNFLPPPTNDNVYVMGTSQFTEYKSLFMQMPLDVLSEAESFSFIKKELHIARKDKVMKLITNLVAKLGGHPLSLQHAVALIKDQCENEGQSKQQSLEDYINKFDISLNSEFPDEYKDKIHKPIYTSLSSNIKKVIDNDSEREAKTLLFFLAYLDPSCITFTDHSDCSCCFGQGIKKPFRYLKRYSLVNVDQDKFICVHRLVQEVCRTYIDDESENKVLDNFFHVFLNTYFLNIHVKFIIQNLRMSDDDFCSFLTRFSLSDRAPRRIKRPDVSSVQDNKNKTLMLAAWQDCEPVVEWLASKGANINVKDSREDSVLHVAAVNDSSCTIHTLFKLGTNMEAENKDGDTPLLAAMKAGSLRAVEALMEVYKSPIDGGRTLMHAVAAAAVGDAYRCVERLIQQGSDIDVKDDQGDTPFFAAVRAGNWWTVDVLVKAGAEVNNVLMASGRTLLHAAAVGDACRCVERLIQQGADIDVKDDQGDTPLIAAARADSWRAVNVLVKAGAVWNSVLLDGGRTLLHAAATGDAYACVERLIQQGADTEAEDDAGYTPLLLAARTGQVDIIVLLARHTNVHATDRQGNTAIHLLAEYGIFDSLLVYPLLAVEVLLEAGAPPDVRNERGDTPRDIARRRGCTELADLLLRAQDPSADVSRTTVTAVKHVTLNYDRSYFQEIWLKFVGS